VGCSYLRSQIDRSPCVSNYLSKPCNHTEWYKMRSCVGAVGGTCMHLSASRFSVCASKSLSAGSVVGHLGGV
jgi:hypothetical protein